MKFELTRVTPTNPRKRISQMNFGEIGFLGGDTVMRIWGDKVVSLLNPAAVYDDKQLLIEIAPVGTQVTLTQT